MMSIKVKTLSVNHALMGLALLGLLVFGGWMALRPGGIGGTGIDNGGGIGGTGLRTGYIGRIDKFGSIWVNGDEIFYRTDMPVNISGHLARADALKIGHVVQVIAKTGDDGQLYAQSISLRYAAIGVPSAVGVPNFKINGHTIKLPTTLHTPNDKAVIAVSGFTGPDGTIIATHIDRLPPALTGLKPQVGQSFTDPIDHVSLSGYAQKSEQGYSLYGYVLDTPVDTNEPITITATLHNHRLKNVKFTPVKFQRAQDKALKGSQDRPQTPDATDQNHLQRNQPDKTLEKTRQDNGDKDKLLSREPKRNLRPAPQKFERQTPPPRIRDLNSPSDLRSDLHTNTQIQTDRKELTRPTEQNEIDVRQAAEPTEIDTNSRPSTDTDTDISQIATEPVERPLEQNSDEGTQSVRPETTEPETPQPETTRPESDSPNTDASEPPTMDAPIRDTPIRDTPVRDAPVQDTPIRAERTDRPERSRANDRPERPERTDRPDRPNRPDRPERPERPDRPR